MWLLIIAEIFFTGTNHIPYKSLGVWLFQEPTQRHAGFVAACGRHSIAGQSWHKIIILKIALHDAKKKKNTLWDIGLRGCFSQSCHCTLWNKSLKLFKLLRRPLFVSFEGCCCSVKNMNLLLKKDVHEVSLRLIQLWNGRGILFWLMHAGEEFLPKACVIWISFVLL